MGNLVGEEPQAVVFVSNRAGAALARRERCLKLAGVSSRVDAERRPSGTYYKLSVHERDAVTAHLALQMGGCTRSSKLSHQQATVRTSVRELARTAWDELLMLVARIADLVRTAAQKLLTGPR